MALGERSWSSVHRYRWKTSLHVPLFVCFLCRCCWCEDVASLQLHCFIFSYGKPKPRTKGQLVAGSPQPLIWAVPCRNRKSPYGRGMRAAGPHWSLGARWPSSDRVAAWSVTGLLAAAAPTLVPHKWQGTVDLISQELQQLLWILWRAPEHLQNNCRPNTVRSLTSALLCNASAFCRKMNKKCTFPTCHHISRTNSSQVLASCPCYFPHEPSLPRPTFLSARLSSKHLPCTRKKRRHWGVIQILHAISLLHTTNGKKQQLVWQDFAFISS